MLVLQVLGDRKSPSEDKREEGADGTGVICAHSTRRMGCATCIALPPRLQGKTRHIGDHERVTRSGYISGG
jgi:hypothetical protein